MKILHTVQFYYPSVGGAQEVVRQLSERLVLLGHEVTVATTMLPNRNFTIWKGVKIEQFNISGSAVKGFSGEIEKYTKFLIESDFDIIMNYAAQQWATDLMLPLLNEIKSKKVLVPCGFSGLYLPEYTEYFENMKTLLKQYDACVYLSNMYRDIDFAREYGANNSIIIPNGASTDEFEKKIDIDIKQKLGIPENHFLILHVGSHTGNKGHKEAIEIFKKSKVKHSTLLIVANSYSNWCNIRCNVAKKLHNLNPLAAKFDKKILITSLSRIETLAAYHQADLFLFPSNIECSPLVLFESIASKTPFLTTDVGNAKEIIEWTNGGELLPTLKYPNGYVKADVNASIDVLEKLFHDNKRRKELANQGYNKWKNSFTWEQITKQYENLYINLLNSKKDEL